MYAGPLTHGTRAVVLFNRHTPFPYSTNITVQFAWLGYVPDSQVSRADSSDCWILQVILGAAKMILVTL